MSKPPITKRGPSCKSFGRLAILAGSHEKYAKVLTASAIKQREIEERKQGKADRPEGGA